MALREGSSRRSVSPSYKSSNCSSSLAILASESILVRLRGPQVGHQELLEIQEAIELERRVTVGWSSMLKKDDQCLRYRAILNWAVNILQQL